MDWLVVLRAIAPKRAEASVLSGVAASMPAIVSRFGVNTWLRQAHFLGQCAHESAGFRTTVEYGTTKYFLRYEPGTQRGRDLGNTKPGDGPRYRGRGIIQLTGRHNYAFFGASIGVDLVGHPESAATFPIAALTAGAFWQWKGLSGLADHDDLPAITRRINGGYNGLSSRKLYVERAKTALASAAGRPPAIAKV